MSKNRKTTPERTANDWIRHLGLTPLPEEGGLYREVYRADEQIAADALPARFGGPRVFSTSIYYLLHHPDISALHRLNQDEVWHYYDGNTLLVCVIEPSGACRIEEMGRDIARGQSLQLTLRAGDIFGAALEREGAYALIGCTVAPGFELADFECIPRREMLRAHPDHRDAILRFTRP